MKIHDTSQQFPNNYGHLYKQQSGGKMIDAVLHAISKLLSLDLIRDSRAMRRRTSENIDETNKMLSLDGEERWMLKVCRKNEGREECLPNEKH